ncbi:hypothetical protein Y032_0017g3229 [Ancylostoma ceylanicum]|uniref:Retrotransposon gag domain-containing protein n=1 Tax=Ancylostoma ceylanicum TaxID=53326 RepID=A0A016V677_9BILA|nr:hypothetical protein Y032_0017g3229 [Ancylostoma ceylanicum]
MGPPVTRSRTASNDSRAAAPTTSSLPSATERLVSTLQELNDDATVHGKDDKTLRDATALAITEVWKDARSATTSLARKINEVSLPSATERLVSTLQELNDDATVHGKDAKTLRDATALAITEVWKDARSATTSLARKINEAVGERIDSIPLVATCSPDGPIPRIVPFVGSGEDATQFSVWLRRLEDIMRMRSATSTSQQKANFLICYLDGVAREKIEELSEQDRADYDAIVTHLKKFFEGPQHRYMARQSLSACQQQPGESSATFANRLLSLVPAATTGQDPSSQKERVLEEFVARLRPDIRY